MRVGAVSVWTVILSFGAVFGLSAPSSAQEFPTCTPELVAAAERSLPDFIPIAAWTDLDVYKTYRCEPVVIATPRMFDANGEEIGTLLGFIEAGSYTTSGTDPAAGSYWVAEMAAGASFAVAADTVRLAMAAGAIEGVVAEGQPEFIAYNANAASTAIFGPTKETLKSTLAANLAVTLVAFNPVPTDRVLIRIRSEPTGAEVWIDKVMHGHTELSGRLRQGALSKIHLSLEGYEDCEFSHGTLSNGVGGSPVFFCGLIPLPTQ